VLQITYWAHPGLITLFIQFRNKAFTGAIPFNQRKSLEAVYAVMQGNRPPRPNHPALTDGLWKLMQRCWDQDRHNRPRMSEVSQALGPPILPSTLQRTRPEEPVSNIQQRLEGLNPTAADYRPLLSQLLDHRGLKPHIQGLEESDLEIFVELLDKVSEPMATSTGGIDLVRLGAQPHPRDRRSLSEDLTQTPEYLQQPWGSATVLHHSE